jgi:hypothetical protein
MNGFGFGDDTIPPRFLSLSTVLSKSSGRPKQGKPLEKTLFLSGSAFGRALLVGVQIDKHAPEQSQGGEALPAANKPVMKPHVSPPSPHSKRRGCRKRRAIAQPFAQP